MLTLYVRYGRSRTELIRSSRTDAPSIPAEPAPPIESRFLFVDVAALRAKQLRRGARVRVRARADGRCRTKPERVAMEEVRRGLVHYDVPDRSGRRRAEGAGMSAADVQDLRDRRPARARRQHGVRAASCSSASASSSASRRRRRPPAATRRSSRASTSVDQPSADASTCRRPRRAARPISSKAPELARRAAASAHRSVASRSIHADALRLPAQPEVDDPLQQRLVADPGLLG